MATVRVTGQWQLSKGNGSQPTVATEWVRKGMAAQRRLGEGEGSWARARVAGLGQGWLGKDEGSWAKMRVAG